MDSFFHFFFSMYTRCGARADARAVDTRQSEPCGYMYVRRASCIVHSVRCILK